MEEREYRITLNAYYPDNGTPGKKKGDFLTGVSRGTLKITVEQIKPIAEQMWREVMKKYPGCMCEIYAHPKDVYPPMIGPNFAVFKGDNFKLFAKGTKADYGTPF